MQTPDHRDRQCSFSVQNFGNAGTRADDLLQVPPGEPLLFHVEFDGLDGVGRVHRIVLGFIGIDERREHIQPVAVARPRLRAPQALDLLERGASHPRCRTNAPSRAGVVWTFVLSLFLTTILS